MSSHLAHGLGTEPVRPDWAPLTDAEVTDVVGPARVVWRSPRPLSAAAVVERDGRRLFVKRHHVCVRTLDGLAEEHAFLGHLRERGVPVVEVLDTVARGEWTYEVHSAGVGIDLYRDALSWSPFRSAAHARAAGEALARLHLSAAGFDAPRRQVQPLVASFTVFAADDPTAALDRYVSERPQLAVALRDFPWREDTRRALLPLYERLSPHLTGLTPLWTHNDWHASNLLWDEAGRVSTVLDFGMSDRTTAVHDLATAIERNTVQWLRPDRPVREADAVALLDGYQSVRPLTPAESAALPELLPLVHAEFALSELGYFHGVTRSAENSRLAYDYYVGHAEWFAGADGRRLLDVVASAVRPAVQRGLPI
ncbi:phosphotransferase enzyme family protein [Streptomyces pseudovenezuelae]|uniref:Ser/Thr protein kinase RdoA (MazF antagonist) n=1 Tax=Streptomyces pseudovenezuelae TaxID=67350 RepID=A0ABT6L8S0_9ACTN|nr:phosphotransferase [Streptomyces pseudovenezuelae]MDH6212730.1 Ser/Thr protein kinase RdoA (MazF antagonist) [Streptomyces pseudovenezuelae]